MMQHKVRHFSQKVKNFQKCLIVTVKLVSKYFYEAVFFFGIHESQFSLILCSQNVFVMLLKTFLGIVNCRR